MVVLERRRALGAAAGWLSLTALLLAAAGRPLAFAPLAIDETRARSLWESTRESDRAGRSLEALASVQQLLRAFPDNPIYLETEARIFEKLSDWRRAAAAWELFVSAAATPIEGCPNLGRAYEKLGLADKALDAHRRCAAFDPMSADAALFHGLALERAGLGAQAQAQFERVLSLAPGYTDAVVGLARLDSKRGAPAAALARLNALPPEAGVTPDAEIARAQALMALGRRDEARSVLQRAAAASPGYADLARMLQGLDP